MTIRKGSVIHIAGPLDSSPRRFPCSAECGCGPRRIPRRRDGGLLDGLPQRGRRVHREPISRALSAFNFRWMTWLCGKLVWTRADCWAAVTSEEAVRKAQVGPFQMRSALKLWRSCASGGAGSPRLSCLQQDYKERFRDKIESELKALQRCRANAQEATTPASIDWLSCLSLRSVMLGPKQVHKFMEDSTPRDPPPHTPPYR